MNDDIESYLYSKNAIDVDTKFLVNYITKYIFRTSNREKIDQYYNKFPDIFDRILGISNKSFKSNNICLPIVYGKQISLLSISLV